MNYNDRTQQNIPGNSDWMKAYFNCASTRIPVFDASSPDFEADDGISAVIVQNRQHAAITFEFLPMQLTASNMTA